MEEVCLSVSAYKTRFRIIKGAIDKSGLSVNDIQEVFMGNVLQAKFRSNQPRQAAMYAGLSKNVPCTTINKVCSSGMKSVMLNCSDY